MESKVQEASQVPRSELDAAFDVCRDGRRMVVQGVSEEAWGYVVWPINGEDLHRVPTALDVSDFWQRDSYTGSTGEGEG